MKPGLVVFDFDGVLTDNRVLVFDNGQEAVFCNRSDGMAIGALRGAGIPVIIMSTETNSVVSARARKLQIEAVQAVNGVPGIEVAQELATLPKVTADADQLRSVVTNLLLNARDAVGSGGHIRVRTDVREGWASLSITDNGCGMTADFMRDSLFRPFKTTKKKGLGIGMFQTKMIVEAHHGTIRVRSDVGKGTTFQVFLPLNPQAR